MSEINEENVHEDFYEAIAFFQQYPDQWEALLNGIVARRNLLIPESSSKLLNYAVVERGSLAIGFLAKMGAYDELLRELSVERNQHKEDPDPEDSE